jgi:hypothetical protein
MDDQECYEWANIFIEPWESLVDSMSSRAKALGLIQVEKNETLIWMKEGKEQYRWLFIDDPSDIQLVRDVFNNDENLRSPSCFVVVKQSDPSDDRGDVIFDMFRLNPQSYLWHFNRVYTPPKNIKVNKDVESPR